MSCVLRCIDLLEVGGGIMAFVAAVALSQTAYVPAVSVMHVVLEVGANPVSVILLVSFSRKNNVEPCWVMFDFF